MKLTRQIFSVLFFASFCCFASNDSTLRSLTYLNTAKLYLDQQNNTKALSYFFKALDHLSQQDPEFNQNKTRIYCGIARAFSANSSVSNAAHDDAKAEEFIGLAYSTLKKCDTVHDVIIYVSVLNTLGNIYRKKAFLTDNNKYVYKALSCFELALAKAQTSNVTTALPLIQTNIAAAYGASRFFGA